MRVELSVRVQLDIGAGSVLGTQTNGQSKREESEVFSNSRLFKFRHLGLVVRDSDFRYIFRFSRSRQSRSPLYG